MKRKLTKTEKFLLIAVALTASIYFYLVEIYDPKIRAYEATSAEIRTTQQEILVLRETPAAEEITAEVTGKTEELAGLERQLTATMTLRKAQTEAEVSKYLAEVNSLILENELLVKEERFARLVGPAVTVLATDPPEETISLVLPPAKEFEWREYLVVLEGSHGELVEFLRALIAMRGIVLIDHITVIAAPPGAATAAPGIEDMGEQGVLPPLENGEAGEEGFPPVENGNLGEQGDFLQDEQLNGAEEERAFAITLRMFI